MAETTSIAWTDHTWSPWEGCTKISPACDHCYAARMNGWLKAGSNWGPGAPRLEYSDEHWKKPGRWAAKALRDGTRPKVFPSVCDPFDNEVDPAWRARFFALIAGTPNLTWQLLTKRIGNVAKMLEAPGMQKCGLPDNVWLGATVVNQEEADRDIPKLLAVPARVRFLSVEPMLGPIDFYRMSGSLLHGLNWVIGGFESGPHARPGHITWARQLRDQCANAGVAWHWKQHGEWAPALSGMWFYPLEGGPQFQPRAAGQDTHDFGDGYGAVRIGKAAAGRMLDGRTHDEFPA
jgi:protein gp37